MTKLSSDVNYVKALSEILVEKGLSEIEVGEDQHYVRLVRKIEPAPVAVQNPAPAVHSTQQAQTQAPSTSDGDSEDFAHHPGLVSSPMVGVVYLTPEPTADPFVKEGQSVSAGQPLMLIEAMKTFNRIKAPRAGTVKRILVASGEPVEYGQPLAVIE